MLCKLFLKFPCDTINSKQKSGIWHVWCDFLLFKILEATIEYAKIIKLDEPDFGFI